MEFSKKFESIAPSPTLAIDAKFKQMKAEGASRAEILRALSKIEGVYVPSLYEVSYKEDGTIGYSDASQEVLAGLMSEFDTTG